MKKNILYIVCGVVVLALLTGMLIFAFSGNEPQDEPVAVNMEGTWEVIAVVQNDAPTFTDGEFMVFDAEKASNYRDGNKEPFASSTYEITADNQLKLPDISREYKIDKKTENQVRLYENADKYLLLAKYKNADMSAVPLNKEVVIGKWKVTYKTGNDQIDEVLEFTADTLNDYRNGAETPTSSSAYSWQQDKYVYADKWSKQFEFHQVSDTVIMFFETDTGVVWELQKAA